MRQPFHCRTKRSIQLFRTPLLMLFAKYDEIKWFTMMLCLKSSVDIIEVALF